MKFLPSSSLFDDVFEDAFHSPFFMSSSNVMRTDIKETDQEYQLCMELPGYTKEDIHLSMQDGYLNVSAKKDTSNEDKDKEGHVIRQERYQGSVSRRFYVSNAVKEEEIKAKFDKGELSITIPKVSKEETQEMRRIPIE